MIGIRKRKKCDIIITFRYILLFGNCVEVNAGNDRDGVTMNFLNSRF